MRWLRRTIVGTWLLICLLLIGLWVRSFRRLDELSRVTPSGGRVLVADQIAPADPLAGLALDRFERARDPGHTRVLPEIDLRQLFEANGLVLVRDRHDDERRALDAYLDLAGCEGEERERARALAPPGYAAEVAWYVLRRA